jgi:hypothetical protein
VKEVGRSAITSPQNAKAKGEGEVKEGNGNCGGGNGMRSSTPH